MSDPFVARTGSDAGIRASSGTGRARDSSLDVLKGLGILIVAMGHIDYTAIGGSFVVYLYTFNVALFFIVAGYTWRAKPERRLISLIAEKFRQIYVPYIVLFFISLAYGHVIVRFVFDDYVIPFDWKETAKALLFSSQWLNTVPTFNFALWFLPIFFLTSVAFLFLQLIRRRTWLYVVVVVAILAASLPIQAALPGLPIVNINVLPVGLVLMAVGHLIATYVPKRRLPLPVAILLLAFTLIVAFTVPGNISHISTYLYYPSAIASFLLYLGLARRLQSMSFLVYVGRNSLILFGIQGLVANTYRFTGIPSALEAGWDGIFPYLVNLAYVMFVSVAIVWAYRTGKAWIIRRLPVSRRRRAAPFADRAADEPIA